MFSPRATQFGATSDIMQHNTQQQRQYDIEQPEYEDIGDDEGGEHIYEYESDFDDNLRGELGDVMEDDAEEEDVGEEEEEEDGDGEGEEGEHGDEETHDRSATAALLDAKLSVIGSELARKLDSTLRRPATSAGAARTEGTNVRTSMQQLRPSTARIDIRRSAQWRQGSDASTTETTNDYPTMPEPERSPSPVGLAAGTDDRHESDHTSSQPPPPNRDSAVTSSGSRVRQSQDLFLALDLANTDQSLKESYNQFWEAMEEKMKWKEQQEKEKEKKRKEEEARLQRKRAAEKKHLQRLNAKLAAARQQLTNTNTDAQRFAQAERGWDDGFAFDRRGGSSPAKHASTVMFERPSVVKAHQALAQHLASRTSSFASSKASSASSSMKQLHTAHSSASSSSAAQSSTVTNNPKPLPPAPSGIVDPSRIRSVVQSHMPRVVLAQLDRQRRRAMRAKSAGSASTATTAAATLSKTTTGVSTAGKRSRKDLSSATMRAPLKRASASSSSSQQPATETEVSPPESTVTAPPARKSRPTSSSSSNTKPSRASSAGVRSTHSMTLLAEQRQAQLHAAAVPPEMKLVPLAHYHRMRRELEELRRKVATLEVENAQLRGETPVTSTTTPTATSSHATAPPSSTTSTKRPALHRASSASPSSSNKPTVANRPTRAASAGVKRASSLSSAWRNDGQANLDDLTTTSFDEQQRQRTAPEPKFKFKLDLSGIQPDGTRDTSFVPAAEPVEEEEEEEAEHDHELDIGAPPSSAWKDVPAPMSSPSPITSPSHAIRSPTATGASATALLSPRARCAVSSCGATRAAGKPYCVTHLNSSQHPSPSPSPSPSNVALASGRSSRNSRVDHSAAAPLSSSPTTTPLPADAPAGGINGFRAPMSIPALGLGAGRAYDYDYESDDNYGGTDVEESTMDASMVSMNMNMNMSMNRNVRSSATGRRREDPSVVPRSSRALRSSQQQPHLRSSSNRPQPDVRTSINEYDDESFAHFGAESLEMSAPIVPPSRVRPGVSRQQSAPAGTTDATSNPLSDSNMLYSAREGTQRPPGLISSRPVPVQSTSRTARPVDVSTPMPAPTPSTAAPPVSSSRRQPSGLVDLEALRVSPYSQVDALNGSFEVTQSGTFKRGGFSINRRGMSTDETGSAHAQQPDVDDTARSVAAAQQWDTTPRPSARASATSRITSRHSAEEHASSVSEDAKPHASSSPSGAAAVQSSSSPPSSASPTSFRSLHASDLHVLGVLGRGSSGVVYRAFHAPSVSLVALKMISIAERDKRQQLTHELRTLHDLSGGGNGGGGGGGGCAYTIGFHGAYFDASHIYIGLEYMDAGSLDDLVEQHGAMSEHALAYVFERVFKGVKYLHKQHIIHRDIKPHNILYNSRGEFKVTDFGIISNLKARDEEAAIKEAKTFVGTLLYMSPERIGGQPYSYACDIWSVALSMLTCRVGQFAIEHQSHWQLVHAIQGGEAILNAFSREQVSDTLRDLLAHCLRANPAERPTAAECLLHPFFAQYRSASPGRPGGSVPPPPNFPPPKSRSNGGIMTSEVNEHASASDERDDRAARKASAIEKKNEERMLAQVCALLARRGITRRARRSHATAAPNNDGAQSGQPQPIDSRLCDRLVARLMSILDVSEESLVRHALIQAHNAHVGLL